MRSFAFLFALVLAAGSGAVSAESIGIYQHGTIVRMRVGGCLPDHGFMAALSGNSPVAAQEICPEYTLMTDKVVYVIVGKPSRDVLPLAETVNFRLRKNEIAIRVNDAKHEVHFAVREMSMRDEWEHRRDQNDHMRGARRFEMPMLRME